MNYENEIKELRAKLDSLENAMNKPTIEVGKWYKEIGTSYLHSLWMPLKVDDNRELSFGFSKNGGTFQDKEWRYQSTNIVLADEKEVLAALTKHADKLYEGVEKVDRSGLDLEFPNICGISKFAGMQTKISNLGFMYNSTIVMDKNGKWATPVVEDWDIEIRNSCMAFNPTEKRFENGKYKLVKI